MGVGFVPVLGHQLSIDAYVELAVGAGDELEGAYVLTDPAQGFACHPGSSQGVASIVAVQNLYFQLTILGHRIPPPLTWASGDI